MWVSLALSPNSCRLIDSPRTTGRGGGVAIVFKNSLKCKQLSAFHYSSFELMVFELEPPQPVLCAVVYRPLKYNKDFL